MSLFHKHEHFWEENERFYAPPSTGSHKVDSGVDVRQIIFGVTTIHFICECGEHKFVEVLGKELK